MPPFQAVLPRAGSSLRGARVLPTIRRSASVFSPRAYSAAPSDELRWSGSSPHTSSGVAALSAPGRFRGAPKPQNQDAFLVEKLQHGGLEATLLGVFDGHGAEGTAAANLVRDELAAAVRRVAAEMAAPRRGSAEGSLWWDYDTPTGSNLRSPSALSSAAAAAAAGPASELDVTAAQSCLERSFSLVAESVDDADCDLTRSGTTALACIVLAESIVTAHCGDSRAVLGTHTGGGAYAAKQLTQDHKPSHLPEMARILAAGGKVMRTGHDRKGNPVGPFRVTLPATNTHPAPSLAVSRSFGDRQLAAAGVVAQPDVAVHPRGAAPAPAPQGAPQEVLVLASDGLWEVFTNEEAVALAAAAPTPEAAAEALMAAARQRWAQRHGVYFCDDITICCAFL